MNKSKKGTIYVPKISQLEKEIENLRGKLKMACLDGDLSENADWSLIKEKFDNLQTQIAWLKVKMTQANQEEEKAITYRLLETGVEKTIKLTNWEADPTKDKISRVSPLGIALTEKKVGEITEVKTNQKKYKVQVLAIK